MRPSCFPVPLLSRLIPKMVGSMTISLTKQTFNVKWHSTSSHSRLYRKLVPLPRSLTFRSPAQTTTMQRWSSQTSTWSVCAPVWWTKRTLTVDLADLRGGIKKSELAKKQRDLKKYGKQIQHEKLRSREQDKKALDDRLQGIKRSECDENYADGRAQGRYGDWRRRFRRRAR